MKKIKLFVAFLLLVLLSCSENKESRNEFIKIFSKASIEALPSGCTTIAEAEETFDYIDSSFKNWNLNNEQNASKEKGISIYELKKGRSFLQMFNLLNTDLESLCLTQSQIVNFCEKYPEHLCYVDNGTFFLFKENCEFFVARVFANSNGFRIIAYRFEDRYIWSSEHALRFVVPKII